MGRYNMPPDIIQEIADLRRRMAVMEKQSSLAYSSVDGSLIVKAGAIVVHDDSGQVRGKYGKQDDGSYTAQDLGGVAPNVPSNPVLSALDSGVGIYWDGTLVGGMSSDVVGIYIWMSTVAAFIPDPTTLVGSMNVAGHVVIPAVGATPVYVCFAAYNKAGLVSAFSAQETITPTVPAGGVASVNGHVGVVVLGASDVGADVAGAAAAAQTAAEAASDTLGAAAAAITTAETFATAADVTNLTAAEAFATAADVTSLATAKAYADAESYATLPSMHGMKAWSYDPAITSGNTSIATSAVLQLVRLHTPVAITGLSKIYVWMTAAGTTLTHVGFGLWNTAAALLTSQVDSGGATTAIFTGATGLITVTLGTPQNIAAGDFYVGFWIVGTGTMPKLATAGTANVINALLATPGLRFALSSTGLSTTAPNPFGAQSNGTAAWWVGVA